MAGPVEAVDGMGDKPDVLEIMLERSRALTWEPRPGGWTRRDAYEKACAAIFREFESAIEDELRATLEDILELYEANTGRSMWATNPDAAAVAKGNRALAGYIILLFEKDDGRPLF